MDVSNIKIPIPETVLELIQNPEVQIISAIIALLILILLILFSYKFFQIRRKEQKALVEIGELPEEKKASIPDSKVETKETIPVPKVATKETIPVSKVETTENQIVRSVKDLDDISWLKKLKSGLGKTRNRLNKSLSNLFAGELDDDTLEKIHESLYRADIGVETCDRLLETLRSKKGEITSWNDAKPILSQRIKEIISLNTNNLDESSSPFVILIVGVNGVGKTTTIGKLAAYFLSKDKSVMLCAGDTFRAAAIDQLGIWAERTEVQMIKHQPGSDPAAVVYDGIKAAMGRHIDILIVDTAGRLHNKEELMEELNKIKKIVNRETTNSSHQTLMVIDATTGQNASQQVRAFNELVTIDGLIVTKLDGTAKGGAIIGICDKYKIPIHFIGVGEQVADLRPFNAEEFIQSIF